jgi:hypothetical protein
MRRIGGQADVRMCDSGFGITVERIRADIQLGNFFIILSSNHEIHALCSCTLIPADKANRSKPPWRGWISYSIEEPFRKMNHFKHNDQWLLPFFLSEILRWTKNYPQIAQLETCIRGDHKVSARRLQAAGFEIDGSCQTDGCNRLLALEYQRWVLNIKPSAA